jgi:hypothetical protein
MSIRCVCPNGHVLRAKDSLGGTSVLCPACKARVNIPRPRGQCISEDAILDILGYSAPTPAMDTSKSFETPGDTWPEPAPEPVAREKHCYKCKREYPNTMHICPFCHTYIANLHDF